MHVMYNMKSWLVKLDHWNPGHARRGHIVSPNKEVGPSMDAEAIDDDILGDHPLLLEL